jgi:hypothetical protein
VVNATLSIFLCLFEKTQKIYPSGNIITEYQNIKQFFLVSKMEPKKSKESKSKKESKSSKDPKEFSESKSKKESKDSKDPKESKSSKESNKNKNKNKKISDVVYRNGGYVVKYTVEEKVSKKNINERDENGNTLFMIVCKNIKKKAIKKFIEEGVDINAQNNNGETALMHLMLQNTAEKEIKLLLDSGADVNILNNDGRSVLYYIADHLYYEDNMLFSILQMFLDKGLNLFKDIASTNSLFLDAYDCKNDIVVVLLLINGINVLNISKELKNIWTGSYNKTNNKFKTMTIILKRCIILSLFWPLTKKDSKTKKEPKINMDILRLLIDFLDSDSQKKVTWE